MGKKGAKLTQKATHVSDGLVQILAAIGSVNSKKMFGGYGLFENGAMFAIVTSDGEIYFKIGQQNRANFEKAGATKQHGKMPYFKVPDRVSESPQLLRQWAKAAIAVAHAAKAQK